MLLHFIFVVKAEDLPNRKQEFEYVKKMADFFKYWIKAKFAIDVHVKCDEMITRKRNILQRLDIHTLISDHNQRGSDIFHVYLCHFRPLWTDCTCEGYFAENFCMVYWKKPEQGDDYLFLAEKNCTVVSHELAHEFLRKIHHKKFIEDVHEAWTRHFYAGLPFEQYDTNFKKTQGKPTFLTIDLSSIDYSK